MSQKLNNYQASYIRRNVYKIYLKDLQQYFHDYVFYFDEDYDYEDHDEALTRKYEDQALGFLRSIGAMISVDIFLAIGNAIVYVRKLPPGTTPVQGE